MNQAFIEVTREDLDDRKEYAPAMVLVDPTTGKALGVLKGMRMEPLGQPAAAHQRSAGAASARQEITAGITRVSLYARGADIRYAAGDGTVTASATSHYLALGERIDIRVPDGSYIAAIRAGTVDGILEITELS